MPEHRVLIRQAQEVAANGQGRLSNGTEQEPE
jgi:hypothetical protein